MDHLDSKTARQCNISRNFKDNGTTNSLNQLSFEKFN